MVPLLEKLIHAYYFVLPDEIKSNHETPKLRLVIESTVMR